MDPECPICLNCITVNFITTGCCHKKFHTQCFINCINIKKECPLCRSTVTNSEEVLTLEPFLPVEPVEHVEHLIVFKDKCQICINITIVCMGFLLITIIVLNNYHSF
jgi:hypothetical protein